MSPEITRLRSINLELIKALESFVQIATADGWNDGTHPMRDACLYHGKLAIARTRKLEAARPELNDAHGSAA